MFATNKERFGSVIVFVRKPAGFSFFPLSLSLGDQQYEWRLVSTGIGCAVTTSMIVAGANLNMVMFGICNEVKCYIVSAFRFHPIPSAPFRLLVVVLTSFVSVNKHSSYIIWNNLSQVSRTNSRNSHCCRRLVGFVPLFREVHFGFKSVIVISWLD